MNYYEMLGEFSNSLFLILGNKITDVDLINEIKVEAEAALYDILVKYKLIEP